MDYVLNGFDTYVSTPYIYPDSWSENDVWRQAISLYVISVLGGYVLYFLFATFSFFLLFDRRLLKHPQILKNQVRREISCAVASIPVMGAITCPIFVLEVRGFSRLYDNIHENRFGWFGIVLNVMSFLLFTDTCIYWLHRWLHGRLLYAPLHKMHHTWKVTTPFASHAFHPLDGFLQSAPYHLYVFLFPMHKLTYLLLFLLVNLWTISIHDSNCKLPGHLKYIVNGAAHHTDHHSKYIYNYGQFFTFWDRLAGSYRHPDIFDGKGPLADILNLNNKNN